MARPLTQDCSAQGGSWGTRCPGHGRGPAGPHAASPPWPGGQLGDKGRCPWDGQHGGGLPRGPQSPRPDASAGALMTEAPLPCPGRPGRTVPAVSLMTPREASGGQGLAQRGTLIRVRAGGRPQPQHPRAPRPSRACSLASRSLGPSERPAPESSLVTGGGPLRGVLCRDAAGHKHFTQPRVWGPLWPL